MINFDLFFQSSNIDIFVYNWMTTLDNLFSKMLLIITWKYLKTIPFTQHMQYKSQTASFSLLHVFQSPSGHLQKERKNPLLIIKLLATNFWWTVVHFSLLNYLKIMWYHKMYYMPIFPREIVLRLPPNTHTRHLK